MRLRETRGQRLRFHTLSAEIVGGYHIHQTEGGDGRDPLLARLLIVREQHDLVLPRVQHERISQLLLLKKRNRLNLVQSELLLPVLSVRLLVYEETGLRVTEQRNSERCSRRRSEDATF